MATLGYSDFDDDAVQTMRLANHTAWRLNHDYIDTEHLLLGLCYRRRSAVADCLARFHVTPDQVATAIARRIRRGRQAVKRGRRPVRQLAKQVTASAAQIASNLGGQSVGTIHLLLAMLKVEQTLAASVLASHGLQYEAVWASIAKPA